jgi:hypothetical protein
MRYVLEPGIKENYLFYCQQPGCKDFIQVSNPRYFMGDYLGLTGARAGARANGWRKTKKGWVCPDHKVGKP